MAIKLTKLDRVAICEKLLARRFDEEEKALCAEADAIGPRLYDELMGEWNERANNLPDGFMKRDSYVDIKMDGVESYFATQWNADEGLRSSILRTKYSSSTHYYPLPEARAIPRGEWPVELKKCHQIYKDIVDLNARASKHIKDREETASQIKGILSAYNTVEQLVAAWPEVEPFCPKEKSKQRLPAVPMESLNLKLGLP